jgi:hypothetical protein
MAVAAPAPAPVATPPALPPPPPPPTVVTGRVDSAGAPASSTLDHAGAGSKVKSPPPAVTVPAPTSAPKSPTRPAPKQDLQIAGDVDAAENSEVQVTGSAHRGKSSSADEGRGEGKGARGPTLGQLAKQSETAAVRGDCAAVRAIVSRIRKLDAAFHKEHVENNAAVKRCVK